MSLHIGNISRYAEPRDVEKAFQVYGKCSFNHKGQYGFVEFTKEIDGEEAMDALQGKNFGGKAIFIEWSKKSGRFEPRDSHRNNRPRKYSRSTSRERRKHRSRRSPSYGRTSKSISRERRERRRDRRREDSYDRRRRSRRSSSRKDKRRRRSSSYSSRSGSEKRQLSNAQQPVQPNNPPSDPSPANVAPPVLLNNNTNIQPPSKSRSRSRNNNRYSKERD